MSERSASTQPRTATAGDADSSPGERILPLCADFDDLDALCATVRSWELDFRPLNLNRSRRSCRIGRIVQRQHGPLELTYARFEASIEQLGAPPAGRLTFAVLGAGVRRLWWRGLDVDATTVLVFRPGAELRSLSGPDFEVDTISIPVETLRRLADQRQLTLRSFADGIETFRLPPVTLTALRARLRHLDATDTPTPDVAMQIGERLVSAWLQAPSIDQPRVICTDPPRARDRAMRACLERLDQPDWLSLTPSRLCTIGGVGERTLQYAFRERFGVTPAAFLKSRRLASVRHALLGAGDSSTTRVGDLAASFGFWHPGQFAADYRRAFGETPTETLRKAKRRMI